jgi:hypothetical protein
MPWRIQPLEQRLEVAVAEYERLRASPAPERDDVGRLLEAIDAELDAWLSLLGLEAGAVPLPFGPRRISERALLRLAILRSRALALQLRAGGGRGS